MKTALKTLLIINFLLLPALTYAAAHKYYVTQKGAGHRTGKSLADAWSVSDFNNSSNWSTTDHTNKINPGDTIYFSGTITSRIKPPEGYGGSSENWVTLDGWEGGTCDPVANGGCASAAVIDRESRDTGVSGYCFYIVDVSYLIVQDFVMQDSGGGLWAAGPSSGVQSTHITIRRNFIKNMEGKGIHITAHWEDPWLGYDYVTVGGALGDGNYIYDTEEQGKTGKTDAHGLGVANSSDVIVSYNKVEWSWQDNDDSSNGISIHAGDRQLVEYNTVIRPQGQACIVLKEYGGNQKIVRFNKTSECGQQGGVAVITGQADQKNFYIYGNLIFNSAGGVFLYRNYDEIHIWSNVIHNIKPEAVTGQGGYAIDISGEDIYTQGDVYVYNNTVSRADMAGERPKSSGISIVGGSEQKVRVKNNILYYNNSDDDDVQLYVAKGADANLVSLEHNTYFSDDIAKVYYFGMNRNIENLKSNYKLEDDPQQGDVSDPGFIDPDGIDNIYGTVDDDYRLDGTNIDNGENLSKCFNVTIQGSVYSICYNDALDPDITNWSTTPPTVGTTKQEYHGSWDRGAYVYKGHKSTIAAPSKLRLVH